MPRHPSYGPFFLIVNPTGIVLISAQDLFSCVVARPLEVLWSLVGATPYVSRLLANIQVLSDHMTAHG